MSIFFIAGILPSIVSAQSILFEDDFENGLSKWQHAYNIFDVWTNLNGQAHIRLPSYFMRYEITPNIYWNNLWQHYQITFDYFLVNGFDKNINFGFINQDEWYELHLVRGDYYITHVINGLQVWEHRGIKSLPANTFHKFKIELNRGQIMIWINNELLANVTDPTYNGKFGKPTLKATTGTIYPTEIFIDNYRIELLEEPFSKPFPVFKQTNPAWDQDEYDSATAWDTTPTIGRWGCALSSLAMILNYYDISKLPDNTELNPQTLNNWLKSQPDGYIGEGFVNWIAGMRLAKIMNPILDTTKLEYKRFDVDPITKAETEIASNKPVVLQIPGHFLIGHDLEDEDILITDPAFDYSLFSQHQKELISIRTFTPSNTDLSYILITHNSELNLQFTDQNIVDSVFNEFLEADSNPHKLTKSLTIHEISKPDSGVYNFEVSQPEVKPFEINFYFYDHNADVKVIHYSGYAGPMPDSYQMSYEKYNLDYGYIAPEVSFADLLSKLQNEYQSGNISYGAFFHLERYLNYATIAESNNQPGYPRYVSLLKYYFEVYADQFTENSKAMLDFYLTNLETKLSNINF